MFLTLNFCFQLKSTIRDFACTSEKSSGEEYAQIKLFLQSVIMDYGLAFSLDIMV